MVVRDRSQMARYLADAMYSSFSRYRQEQSLEFDTGLLKSYIIEAHTNSHLESPHDGILVLLQQIENQLRIRVGESDDETLFILLHGKDTYYLDVADQRFWILHTIALSNRADKLITDLKKSSPYLDSAWLPTQLLERVARFGDFRGFSAIHDETPFLNGDTDTVKTELETMHLRLWGGGAAVILGALRSSGVFPEVLSIGV